MYYNPKLKIAIKEIEAILSKHDLGGFIVLHYPGHSEYVLKIDPSYSCAKFDGDLLRVKAKKEDYNGIAELRDQKIKDTSNMLTHIVETGQHIIMQLVKISIAVDKATGAEHGNGNRTSGTQQNN